MYPLWYYPSLKCISKIRVSYKVYIYTYMLSVYIIYYIPLKYNHFVIIQFEYTCYKFIVSGPWGLFLDDEERCYNIFFFLFLCIQTNISFIYKTFINAFCTWKFILYPIPKLYLILSLSSLLLFVFPLNFLAYVWYCYCFIQNYIQHVSCVLHGRKNF